MKAALLEFFTATADSASIYVGHGLEERGVEFGGIVRFGEREFGNRSIELELQALQKNRMEDVALIALPAQNSISQDQLHALCLAVDAAVE